MGLSGPDGATSPPHHRGRVLVEIVILPLCRPCGASCGGSVVGSGLLYHSSHDDLLVRGGGVPWTAPLLVKASGGLPDAG